MLLHFNGEIFPVSEESVSELLDMLFEKLVGMYSNLDLPTRVILTPMARGLVREWLKVDKAGVFSPLQKKEEPVYKLAEMMLGYVELMSGQFEAEVLIKNGKAHFSWYHPLLKQDEVVEHDVSSSTA